MNPYDLRHDVVDGRSTLSERRPMGSLVNEVLATLWASDGGATPSEVLERMGTDLAYTTVTTILTRLWKKGLVDRERVGRAYLYKPNVSEADLAASRMQAQLEEVGDREAALSQFVGALSPKDEKTLRHLLSSLEG